MVTVPTDPALAAVRELCGCPFQAVVVIQEAFLSSASAFRYAANTERHSISISDPTSSVFSEPKLQLRTSD